MEDLRTATIKSIVTKDFRAAAVFEKYSLDFCCKGGVTIDQACLERRIDAGPVFNELEQITSTMDANPPSFNAWPLDALINHIVNVHHTYVRTSIPMIQAHTQKVARVHGGNHPEAVAIAEHFAAVSAELQHHMIKEEQILFPYIISLVKAKATGSPSALPPFMTVQNPIRMMEAEHQSAGNEMYAIRSLSTNYLLPPDACTTYRVSYEELHHFEEDLHQHVHLENNMLFPKAIAMEQELLDRHSTTIA